eukprot:8843718-Alexandrium_andersonii.AAC.1
MATLAPCTFAKSCRGRQTGKQSSTRQNMNADSEGNQASKQTDIDNTNTETETETPVSYTHLTLPTICSV